MKIQYKLAKLIDLLPFFKPKIPYWLEIKTENPTCTYYFGDFNSKLTAKLMENGYIQDLLEEKAIIISVKIKQCNPSVLTIVEEN